jgi:hypothetical protein
MMMAKIRISRPEAGGEQFPRLCMRCGRPADVDVPQTFHWKPSWIIVLLFFGLWPYFLLTMLMRKSMRVVAPMCRDHAGHWRNRALYYWFGILFWIVYLVGVGTVVDSLPIETQRVFVFGGLLAAIIWLVSVPIYSNSGIKASEINERSIILTNVHKDFANGWYARR